MDRRFSAGWVFVSFLMIAGGLMVAAVAVVLSGRPGEWGGHGLLFLGALAGGFFAGRASPGKTIAEAGLAGVLLVVTVFGGLWMVPGTRAALASAGRDALVCALEMAFVAGLGGFVGGLIGERSSRGERSTSRFRWWGISILIHLGLTYLLVFGLLTVGSWAQGRGANDKGAGLMFAAVALAALGGGFIAQAVAPRRMRWACGAGALGTVGLVLALQALFFRFTDSSTPGMGGVMVIGGLVLGVLGTLIGAIGAALAWRLVASRRAAAEPHAAQLPEARLQ